MYGHHLSWEILESGRSEYQSRMKFPNFMYYFGLLFLFSGYEFHINFGCLMIFGYFCVVFSI